MPRQGVEQMKTWIYFTLGFLSFYFFEDNYLPVIALFIIVVYVDRRILNGKTR